MKILIASYSRSGHTSQLSARLEQELRRRGHVVVVENIASTQSVSKWRLALPLLSTLPVLPLLLCVPPFRRWWLRHYPQAEQDLQPLQYPDVSGFDRVCLGAPKWLYLAYPLARYLRQVRGLHGKPVGAFATFCGPPLRVFELEMLFVPLRHRVEAQGGRMVSSLAVSSGYHEFFFFHEMEYVFRLLSWLAFSRPLNSFALNSAWAEEEVGHFCNIFLSDTA